MAKVYLLATGPDDSDTVIGKLSKKKGGREDAYKVLVVLRQLSELGVSMFAQQPKKMRRVKGNLVEIKVQASVVRAICYNRNGQEAVVVIDVFDGHQGSGNVSRQIRDAEKKVPVVEALLKANGTSGSD